MSEAPSPTKKAASLNTAGSYPPGYLTKSASGHRRQGVMREEKIKLCMNKALHGMYQWPVVEVADIKKSYQRIIPNIGLKTTQKL